MIGPDYSTPEAPTSPAWIDSRAEGPIRDVALPTDAWWQVFGDPVLTTLVETAYRQNPGLQAAGARVLEALARRGIAVGTLFPQQQDAFGAYLNSRLSKNRATQTEAGIETGFDDWQVGFDAFWELDVWGRLRRNIEAADAEVLASVADYDDVLVSLVAEVAINYITLRAFEERLAVAHANVTIQERSYDLALARYEGGAVTALDAEQAKSLLADTSSQIPGLEAGLRQTRNTICILLGVPPEDLAELLPPAGTIPTVPAELAVGIPAELLRRRPDVRRSERELAAQSARIGIAKADLLPQFALVGSISLAAEDFAELMEGRSVEGFGGPTFRWAILNYGRISSNVRVQDARYQALVGDYENTVLRAQAEVENSIASFLGARSQVGLLTDSVGAATRAVELADLQYREGATDYTRVLDSQQFLVTEEDRLVTTRANVALSVASLYKALGGGWEVREGESFVSPEVAEQMRDRTRWGGTVEASGQERQVEDASSGTEKSRWWRWRAWRPQW
jgi:NodT family efflux transporter outer membrane factor (OMF) lipoprotein